MTTTDTDRKPVPQRYRVLQYIAEMGSITRLSAANHVGCFELASRIGELEAEGCVFLRYRNVTKNRYGDTVRFMRYQIDTAPAELLAKWCGGTELARINPALPNRKAYSADVTTSEAIAEQLAERAGEAARNMQAAIERTGHVLAAAAEQAAREREAAVQEALWLPQRKRR